MTTDTILLLIVMIVGLKVGHFISDFPLQSNWMALNKSKDWRALTAHAGVYSIGVTVAMACTFGLVFWPTFWSGFVGYMIYMGWSFAVLTFLLHWITDFFTSRLTSKLWFFRQAAPSNYGGTAPLFYYVEGRRYWFFVVIGFDQLIHDLTLIATFIFTFYWPTGVVHV